ncbi:MAG TPA: hypothetical protein VMR34_05665 [Candidatus Saccharimonadales bacterium]|nr:hypothetical protein [Candidatus Saccharimonadales bacterium]
MSGIKEQLLNKQMNRKEFMAHIGAALLIILGLTGLVKTLINYNSKPEEAIVSESSYGNSTYGP